MRSKNTPTRTIHYNQLPDASVSPTRQYVLETSNIWSPQRRIVRSPQRGLRTADMPPQTASILDSANAAKYSNIRPPMQLHNYQVLTLQGNADLTLNAIESGFAPQKLCKQLKKLGVLVEIRQNAQKQSVSLISALKNAETPRKLPDSVFEPKSAEILNFYAFSVQNYKKARNAAFTESIHYSLAQNAISNTNFLDNLPQTIPGSDFNVCPAVKKNERTSYGGKNFCSRDENFQCQNHQSQQKVQSAGRTNFSVKGSRNLGAFTAETRSISPSAVTDRLDLFQTRQNAAIRSAAHFMSLLCVDYDKIDIYIIQQLNSLLLAARQQDKHVFSQEMTNEAEMKHLAASSDKNESATLALSQLSQTHFNEQTDDLAVSTVIALLNSGIVQRLKILIFNSNPIQHYNIYCNILHVTLQIMQIAPQCRDSLYEFFEGEVGRSIQAIFNFRGIVLSRQFILDLCMLCRLDYAVCPALLRIAIHRLEAQFGRPQNERVETSSLRSVLQNSLAKMSNFALENERLTKASQIQDLTNANQSMSDSSEIAYFLVLLASCSCFGVLQLIVRLQEQSQSLKQGKRENDEKGRFFMKQLQESVAKAIPLMNKLIAREGDKIEQSSENKQNCSKNDKKSCMNEDKIKSSITNIDTNNEISIQDEANKANGQTIQLQQYEQNDTAEIAQIQELAENCSYVCADLITTKFAESIDYIKQVKEEMEKMFSE